METRQTPNFAPPLPLPSLPGELSGVAPPFGAWAEHLDPTGRVQARFGLAADAGFLPLPDVVLFYQCELGIKSEDLNVLLNVLVHWYTPDQMPFPRVTTIAKRMGVSDRSVQRSLSRLRKLGLIGKAKNSAGREVYDLKPLVEKLAPYARKRLALRSRMQAEKAV